MKSHIGERVTTKKGYTAELKEWHGRERVVIEFLETGERRCVTYLQFRKRKIEPNTFIYPENQVPFRHAATITIITIVLILGVISGLLYCIFK